MRWSLRGLSRRWLCGLTILILASQARSAEFIRCDLADGFDFPVGKPNAANYYKARGYWPNGHMGEDWNGRAGGDSDLGAPIYSTARGIVIVSENIGVGWGNCIIVRHAYRDATGKVAMVDSQYGHLLQRFSKVGQIVEKGQLIATMGSNNGMYPAHLHFEMRKNLHIGMNRSQFARDNTNYYSPTDFINKHRILEAGLQKYPIPTGLFSPYGRSLADASSDSGLGGIKVPVLPTVRPGLPATGPSDDDEDFWAKLRTRLKESKTIEVTPEPK
ncbi:MAG: M23 family metallopeptidase [Prosthecobacter sp.]|nr:M23 family metallopeptidase [Prosthecobacter sp.]